MLEHKMAVFNMGMGLLVVDLHDFLPINGHATGTDLLEVPIPYINI